MTLSIYFDDDFVKHSRATHLRAVGFDVVIPKEAGTAGLSDPEHLTVASRLGRVLVSHNVHDFHSLHTERMLAGIDHEGIVLVHQQLNLSTREIVRRFQVLDGVFAQIGMANQLLFLSNFD